MSDFTGKIISAMLDKTDNHNGANRRITVMASGDGLTFRVSTRESNFTPVRISSGKHSISACLV